MAVNVAQCCWIQMWRHHRSRRLGHHCSTLCVSYTYSTAQRRSPRASSARRRAHRLGIYSVNNSDRNSSIHVLLYEIMFSLLTMLEARIAYSHKSTCIYIHSKLNIMSYKSTCIELVRLLLFTLYIHSLCASRRAELARGQRRWAVLHVCR